jgi:putative ABC transport system substrate-binding protein
LGEKPKRSFAGTRGGIGSPPGDRDRRCPGFRSRRRQGRNRDNSDRFSDRRRSSEARPVASFSRPGGNASGIAQLSTMLVAKRLELLHELAPKATLIAVLVDPEATNREEQLAIVAESAQALGLQTLILERRDFDSAFAILAAQKAGALFVAASSYWVDRRDQIVSLAARFKVPACYESREFATAGGLMTYGTDFGAVYRQVGGYTGRILKGEKVAELPVQQPTKFEFVINLKTAKALELEIPPTLLLRADELIE